MAIRAHIFRRWLAWQSPGVRWARQQFQPSTRHLVHTHSSTLLRDLEGVDMQLQHNKVTNLRLAVAQLNGVVIRPGETFSFNRLVGNCTRRKGYVPGLVIRRGEVGSGVGGGICQIANLLHWLALHSGLTVTQRSEHSYDLFPDSGRTVPWGVGCSIAYNYVDLMLRNDTASTFRVTVWLTDTDLCGQLLADAPPTTTYEVTARHERFAREGDRVTRENEIWRRAIDTVNATTSEELLIRNKAVVRYPIDPATILPRSTTAVGDRSTERSSSGLLG